MNADELLRQRLAERGVQAITAVPAFTGLYPVFNGFGNWEIFFTRHRLLVCTARGIQQWTLLTGLVPGTVLRENGLGCLELTAAGGRYDRFRIGQRRFWVPVRHRASLTDWARLGDGAP